jgi:hypothetical protein
MYIGMLYPENDTNYPYRQGYMREIEPDLDFSNLEPIEIPIPYGSGVTYYLREASEDVHKQYRSRAMKCYGTDGLIKNPDMAAETPQWFVQMNLFTEPGGDVKKRVGMDVVKSMPTRVIAKMFTRLRKISGMDEEDLSVEELKRRIAELQAQLEAAEQREASGGIPPTS